MNKYIALQPITALAYLLVQEFLLKQVTKYIFIWYRKSISKVRPCSTSSRLNTSYSM